MSMFDENGNDSDQALKEAVLQGLLDKVADALGAKMGPADKGMAVEVAAPDKDALKAGLEKAGDVVDKAPEMAMADKGSGDDEHGLEGTEPAAQDEESDEQRLLELLAHEQQEEDER